MSFRSSRWAQPRPRRRRRSGTSCWFVAILSITAFALTCAFGRTLLSALGPRSADGKASGGLGVGAEFVEYPRWEGEERVNILVMGIDQRGQEQGPWRTDTMMVLSLDPASKSAGMLSIPRDLWVEIPGYGQNRINTAYVVGETNLYPGGGPALAKKTVQHNLGEPIHYYIHLNFMAAEKLVDLIDGIEVYVEREINDPLYPDYAYGYDPLYIPAGWQHMDGKLALKYARSRHAGSDFDRARRQQQIVLAVRDKLVQPEMLARLLPRASEIANTLDSAIQSDLTLDQVLRLAQLGAETDSTRIRSAVIDSTMTQNWVTPNGAQVLIPDRARMAVLHDIVFSSPGQADSQAEQIAAEVAQIVVQNGTPQPNLAAQTADWLRGQGFVVANITSAPNPNYQATMVLVYTGKWTTARALAASLGVPDSAVTPGSSPEGVYDIKVILGADYRPAAH